MPLAARSNGKAKAAPTAAESPEARAHREAIESAVVLDLDMEDLTAQRERYEELASAPPPAPPYALPPAPPPAPPPPPPQPLLAAPVAVAVLPPAAPPAGEDLSAYERERLGNIARNEEGLRSLGLLEPLIPLPPPPAPPRRRAPSAEPPQPSRHSSRSVGPVDYTSEKVDSSMDHRLGEGRSVARPPPRLSSRQGARLGRTFLI